MKTVLAVLAALVTSTEAGLTILSPSCSLGDENGLPYSDDQCVTAQSSFYQSYRGLNQTMPGKIINYPACDGNGLPAGCYAVNEALFGVNPYGEQISGLLFYNFMQDPTGCNDLDASFGNFDDDDEHPTRKILLVDRGVCSFVRKVRMAQNAGAAAVIVMDDQFNHNKRIYMSNDGSGDDIRIPSVFVDYETGTTLKTAIKYWRDGSISASLDWALPETEVKVRWSLWTSAEDRVAKTFKENFQLAFQRIGANRQEFTPHFQISDGSRYCFRSGASSNTINICGDTCLYGGLYCAISTDPGLSHDVKGKHIVSENFRQLCIFNQTAGNNRDKATSMWWDYIDLFNENCNDDDPEYSVTCSENQMRAANYKQSDIDKVRRCTGSEDGTTASIYDFADPFTGQPRNYILDQELRQQQQDNIFTIPTIIINNEPYRGGYTCPHPPQLASCGVLSAVCSAYVDGLEPAACFTDYCWDLKDDCGTCLKKDEYNARKNLMCCDMTPGFLYDACGDCVNASIDFKEGTCLKNTKAQMASGFVGGIVGTFIVLVLVIGAVVAAAMILLKKKDQETRRYVDSVVSSYLPMEDGNEDEDDENAALKANEGSTATL